MINFQSFKTLLVITLLPHSPSLYMIQCGRKSICDSSLTCQASLSTHINSKCKSGARYFLSLLFMKIHSYGPVIWRYVVRYLQSCFVMFNSCYLSLFKYFKINWSFYIAWKVSKYGVFSDPYFPVFGLNTEYLSVFSPNTGKYGPEKIRIWTLFTQFYIKFFFLDLKKNSIYGNSWKSRSNTPQGFWNQIIYLLICL